MWERKHLRAHYGFLDVIMSEGIMRLNGKPAYIEVTGKPKDVDASIDLLMIRVCECTSTDPCFQLAMMYDLALANPDLSWIDGDDNNNLAWVMIPWLYFREAQWVGVFELPYHDRNGIARIFVGKGGQDIRRLCDETRCLIEVTKDDRRPRVIVRSPDAQDVKRGMEAAKERVKAIQP